MAGYIPASDSAFDGWAFNFDNQLTISGVASGVTAPQVTAYNALFLAWRNAYETILDPAQRTPVTVQTKVDARIALQENITVLAALIQAFPGNTPSEIAAYGLTVRLDTRTPIPAPTDTPVLAVENYYPLETKLRIRTLGSDSNRYPPNVVGCNIYCKKGTVAPISIAECTFVGRATKRFFTQFFEVADAGENCFYLAQYVTRTDLVGPSSPLLSTTIVG